MKNACKENKRSGPLTNKLSPIKTGTFFPEEVVISTIDFEWQSMMTFNLWKYNYRYHKFPLLLEEI